MLSMVWNPFGYWHFNANKCIYTYRNKSVVAVIVLARTGKQSMSITANIVISSIPTYDEGFLIQPYVIRFVSDLRKDIPVSSLNNCERRNKIEILLNKLCIKHIQHNPFMNIYKKWLVPLSFTHSRFGSLRREK